VNSFDITSKFQEYFTVKAEWKKERHLLISITIEIGNAIAGAQGWEDIEVWTQ